jgi:hypothetical protein
MMISDRQRSVISYSAWAFIIHAFFVIVAVTLEYTLWGTEVPLGQMERLLRLIDMPMEWAIRPSLQSLPLLPGWLVFNSVRVAVAVNDVFLRVLFGGIFYAALAAAIIGAR